MANQATSDYSSHRALIEFILNKKSGTLVFNPDNRRLFFSEGNLIFASSENKQENFSEILVHIGVLDAAKLKQLRGELKPGESLGRKLKEQELVDSKQLAEALRQQITNIIDRCVAEKDLSCEIQENVLPGKLPRLKIQTIALITKSLTNLNDTELYDSLPFDDPIAKSPSFDNLVETLQFPPSYNGLLRHLSDSETVYAEDLGREFGLKPRQIDGFLYVLNLLGMIHFQTAESLLEETITGLGLGEAKPSAEPVPTEKEDALADMLPDTQDLDDTLSNRKNLSDDSLDEDDGEPPAIPLDEETRPVNERFGALYEPSLGGNQEDLKLDDLSQESFEVPGDEGDLDGAIKVGDLEEVAFESEFSNEPNRGHQRLEAHVENLETQLQPLSSGGDSDGDTGDLAPHFADTFESPTSLEEDTDGSDTLPSSFADPAAATAAQNDNNHRIPMDGRTKVSFNPDQLVRSLQSAEQPDSDVIMPDAPETREPTHKPRSSRKPLWLGLGLAAILALGFLGFLYYRGALPLGIGKNSSPPQSDANLIEEDPIPIEAGEDGARETFALPEEPPEDSVDSDPSGAQANAEPEDRENKEPPPTEAENIVDSSEDSSSADLGVTQAPLEDPTPVTQPPTGGYDLQNRVEESLAKFMEENGVFTLAFMVACETSTIEALFQYDRSEEILLSPRRLGSSSDCYLLSWGIFPTRSEALANLTRLPSRFIEGGETPWATKIDPEP